MACSVVLRSVFMSVYSELVSTQIVFVAPFSQGSCNVSCRHKGNKFLKSQTKILPRYLQQKQTEVWSQSDKNVTNNQDLKNYKKTVLEMLSLGQSHFECAVYVLV